MKIAIPYENGQVFQHFGHSAQFKLYTAEEGRITGNADSAAAAYLSGTLVFDPNARCTHHDHEESHSCGAHACHADKGGCTGSCH